MSDVVYQRFILTTSFGSGLLVWGVLTALLGSRRWFPEVVVAGLGIGMMAIGVILFTPHWWPVVPAAVVIAPLGVTPVRSWLVSLFRPRVVATTIAILAVVVVSYEGWQYDRSSAETDSAFEMALGDMPPETKEATIFAKTDRGTMVVLHDPVDPRSRIEANERDRISPTVTSYLGYWIRRGPADDQSNCHGWVFTAGRYNLIGRYVNTILTENGYELVSEPRAGDVCVYTDQRGEVLHTGLVRGVLNDSTVMIESKWGRLGVYLHSAGDTCYGTNITYYRTDRIGHTLVGLGHSTEPKITAPVSTSVPPGP